MLIMMNNYIINSFIYSKKNNFNQIFSYLQKFNSLVKEKIVKNEIKYLLKNLILNIKNNNYYLTDKGLKLMNNNIY